MGSTGAYPKDRQQMLVLAAVAYRGIELAAVPDKRALIRQAMTKSLDELSALIGPWDIVWGPATFSATRVGFDDAAMYVAKSRQEPPTYAIAVRGTNPISLFDWLFGDLIVTRTIAWPYGAAPGAKISFSTALGLSILQHLKSGQLQPGPTAQAGKAGAGHAMAARAAAGAIAVLRATTPKAVPLKDQIDTISGHLSSIAANAMLKILDVALAGMEAVGIDPLAELMSGIDFEEGLASGIDLKDFLAGEVAAGGGQPINIYVTGHSKGGALSPTLALWLADTQGTGSVAQKDQWDPSRKATVCAYSYAGPTAGNGAFVAHCNAVIGPRYYRIANALDVVPHAWNKTDLAVIPNLYKSKPAVERAPLKALVEDLVIPRIANLDYRQGGTGANAIVFPSAETSVPEFAVEAAHQHLDAYLSELLPGSRLTALNFLEPVIV